MSRVSVAACVTACLLSVGAVHPAEKSEGPWPAPVKAFVAPGPGEHPRLFFRKAEVPNLRKRAQTTEGMAIIARCEKLLGIDGHPEQPYTLWHGAAAGFLYQATGEGKYADLAKAYVDKALTGADDKDPRYNFARPREELRVGPAVSAVAMAYDLAYDGWDKDCRQKVCEALMNYNTPVHSLESLSLRPRDPNPISNHLALQTGGAGLAILAIRGDEGADDARLARYQEGVDRWARKILTEDFGEGGYFGEHAGPGSRRRCLGKGRRSTSRGRPSVTLYRNLNAARHWRYVSYDTSSTCIRCSSHPRTSSAPSSVGGRP